MTATLHPMPPGLTPSDEYRVAIDGIPVHVHRQVGFAGGTVSWVSFDLHGPVEVEVHLSRMVDQVEALPTSAGVVAQLVDPTTVRLRIDRPGALLLRFDDAWYLPLHLFADSPESTIPAGPEVIRFGPGVHHPGNIPLRSGQTLQIDGGAVVHGTVRAVGDRITIRGRGILCASHVPQGQAPDGIDAFGNPMVQFRDGRDCRIEGVTLLDSPNWTLVAHRIDGWRVDGVRIFSERGWSTDGINPCNCRDVLIERCFVRSKDDCVAVKGLLDQSEPGTWTPIHDIEVRHCVCWSDNNNALVVGCETRASAITRIRFHDLDILRTANTCGDDAAALAVIALDDTRIEDIVFERIRIHEANGAVFTLQVRDSVFGIPGLRRPGEGRFAGIRFRDITVERGANRRNFIRGQPGSPWRDVSLAGVTIAGRPLTTVEDGRILITHGVVDVIASQTGHQAAAAG